MTYIVIEGVIGAGKTALTRTLGEQFEENPLLKEVYSVHQLKGVCLPFSGVLQVASVHLQAAAIAASIRLIGDVW